MIQSCESTPTDPHHSGATIDIDLSHVKFLGNLTLNLWDCGGQEAFMENYLSQQRAHVFSNVGVLIYVFDIESRDVERDLATYVSIISALVQYSREAKIFVLIHKMDLIQPMTREDVFDHRATLVRRKTAEAVAIVHKQKPDHHHQQPPLPTSPTAASDPSLNLQLFATSIWDQSLYKAWASIIHDLVPNLSVIETQLASLGLAIDALEQRHELLLLIEKDAGHALWYCHSCALLHRISFPRIADGDPASSVWVDRYRSCWVTGRWCSPRCYDDRRLQGTFFTLDYKTVRLVMNRHFLGPPNGLPINVLDAKLDRTIGGLRCRRPGDPLPWKEKWSARIVDDELFLSATRTLSGAGLSDGLLRGIFDNELHQVCGHITISGRPRAILGPFHASALLLPPKGTFTPCRGLVESCPWCLTDCVTTVERRLEDWGEAEGMGQEAPPRLIWFITVTSYHRLGSGRCPTDLKWQAFGRTRKWDVLKMQRNLWAYPPGSVRAMWESHEAFNGLAPKRTQDETGAGHYLVVRFPWPLETEGMDRDLDRHREALGDVRRWQLQRDSLLSSQIAPSSGLPPD